MTGRGETRAAALDGTWRVAREAGLLPPLAGVVKRIRGARGVTLLGPLPIGRFRVVPRDDGADLVYTAPLPGLVDRIRPRVGGGWLGEARLFGRTLGSFRMDRGGGGAGGPP